MLILRFILKSFQKVPGTFWQLLFSPAAASGRPHIQMQEVLLLVKPDAIKIYILTYLQKGNQIDIFYLDICREYDTVVSVP